MKISFLKYFKNRAGKRATRSLTGNLVNVGVLVLVALFMSLPFIYSIMQSLKPLEEIFLFPPRFFVTHPTFDNFFMIAKYSNNTWVPFSRYLANSIFVTLASTVGHVFVSSMAAYVLAKTKIKGKKIFFFIIVSTLMLNGDVTAIPQYVVMSFFRLIDTQWALILPAIAAPLGVFLLKQYMETIPDAIIESATIDGAGTFQIYYRIIMPMIKPGWLTLIIFTFQAVWNNEGRVFLFSEEIKLLPTMLRQIAQAGIARAGLAAAAAVVLMIPPIITFVMSQNKVIQTMAHSGIK